MEEGESAEEAALRELKEETGFSGKMIEPWKVRLLPVCSGTGSESTCLMPVLVSHSLLLYRRLTWMQLRMMLLCANNPSIRTRSSRSKSFPMIPSRILLIVASCEGLHE